jgi:hypothetical protein
MISQQRPIKPMMFIFRIMYVTVFHIRVNVLNVSQFPRVTVFLDANSLELTSEAKKDIAKVKDKKSLEWFSEKYGPYMLFPPISSHD